MIASIGHGKIVRSREDHKAHVAIMANQHLCLRQSCQPIRGYDMPLLESLGRNDINVLNKLSLFNDALKGNGSYIIFLVNGTQYTKVLLTNGIYPEWTTFVKCFSTSVFQNIKFKDRSDMWGAPSLLRSMTTLINGKINAISISDVDSCNIDFRS